MRRSLVAIMAIALAFGGAAPTQAQEGTRCTFEFVVTLTPGFSMNPSDGTHSSGDTGTATCDGLVNNKLSTGAGTLSDDGPYEASTCSSGRGSGVDTIEIPTADGMVKVVSEFTYVTEPSTKGGVLSVRFEGSRYTGYSEVTPTEGDCVTAPVTKLKGFGEGTLHG